jgi:hypothetical protein
VRPVKLQMIHMPIHWLLRSSDCHSSQDWSPEPPCRELRRQQKRAYASAIAQASIQHARDQAATLAAVRIPITGRPSIISRHLDAHLNARVDCVRIDRMSCFRPPRHRRLFVRPLSMFDAPFLVAPFELADDESIVLRDAVTTMYHPHVLIGAFDFSVCTSQARRSQATPAERHPTESISSARTGRSISSCTSDPLRSLAVTDRFPRLTALMPYSIIDRARPSSRSSSTSASERAIALSLSLLHTFLASSNIKRSADRKLILNMKRARSQIKFEAQLKTERARARV